MTVTRRSIIKAESVRDKGFKFSQVTCMRPETEESSEALSRENVLSLLSNGDKNKILGSAKWSNMFTGGFTWINHDFYGEVYVHSTYPRVTSCNIML